ncbi:MAG: aminoglycoside nucleotidyltransferase [Clostridiales bacterium]|nr:aminoglycoside nucleotidyltransferase [Clostridiales bacterium]
MKLNSVVAILRWLNDNDISFWLDGGWGVDALLGRQTREHGDIDILIKGGNAARFIGELACSGYTEKQMDYTTPSHRVWVRGESVVDLHLLEFDAEGDALYEGESYPSWMLGGHGVIGGIDVLCLTPEAQLLFHQGYEHDERDEHDVRVLCEAFHLEAPDGYAPVEAKGHWEVFE